MIYLIIANVAIALSFSLYHLFFRKLTFFQWNRFYLLGAVLVSLLIPVGLFINLSAYFVQETTIPTIHLAEIMDISVISFSPEAIPYRLMDVLIPVYWTGVLLSLGYLLYRLLQLRKLFSREEDYLSFSFFRRVFMGQKVQQHETILTHEQVHVQQGHSYDIVFMELVKAFNWFNPTLYFMLKEVKFQHECIADEVCSEDKVAYAELLVANALRVEQSALVHEFSNQSFLKKRIMMLFKNKSSHRQKLFYLSVLPVLLILTGSTLLFNTTKAKEIVSNVENRIQDVALPVKKQFVVDLEASDQKGSVQQELADTHDERVLGVAIPVLSVIAEPDTIKGIVKYINNAPQFHSDGRGDNILFTSVEINPSPKGGMDAFRKWIAENCRYPVAAINAEAKGTVTISFVVEEDGKLSDIKTLKDIGYGTGDAVVRLMEKAELWNPGIQNGRAVRTAYTLPIRLDLSQMADNNASQASQTETNKRKEFFGSVEIHPAPKMGMDAFRKWIADNYQYPAAAIAAELRGTITVGFVVEEDGSFSDIKVIKDLGHGTGPAAVQLMKKAEAWNPGIKDGNPVRTAYTLPIRLDLHQMDEKKTYNATPEIGYERLREWLSGAFKLPRKLTAGDVDPYMYATFDVAENGALSNFRAKSDLEVTFTNQFVELLKNTKWKPGEERGVKQKSKGHIWVKFDRNGKFISEYTRVELMPYPKTGMDDFRKNIAINLKYPAEMIEKKKNGKVEVFFEIRPDGSPGNFKILEEPHKGVGDNMIELIRNYGHWNPGIIDGRPVLARYSLAANMQTDLGYGVIAVDKLKLEIDKSVLK